MGKRGKGTKATQGLSYTQQLQNAKREKAFWASLFPGLANLADVPAHVRHVSNRSGILEDEQLALLVSRVQSIDMLDIYDGAITAVGIQHLTRLSNLTELRLKECLGVQDDCLPFLRSILGLELLHVGDTGITLDGIVALGEWPTLKTLFLSSHLSRRQVREKVTQLLRTLPMCEIIINHKAVDFYLEADK